MPAKLLLTSELCCKSISATESRRQLNCVVVPVVDVALVGVVVSAVLVGAIDVALSMVVVDIVLERRLVVGDDELVEITGSAVEDVFMAASLS